MPQKADINLWGLFWVAVASACAVGVAWSVPRLVRFVPWQAEVYLGQMLHTDAMQNACDVGAEPAWQDVLALVTRLYPQSAGEGRAPLTVHLIDNPQVNAFASLGGQVFILTGLLQHVPGPDGLAGVLAHELEHVSRRHLLRHLVDDGAFTTILLALLGDDSAASRMAKTIDFWSGLHFSRAQETEADEGGRRRMQQAGIGLDGLIEFFEHLRHGVQMPAWASDHPGLTERIAALRQAPNDRSAPAMSQEQWQAVKALCHGESKPSALP